MTKLNYKLFCDVCGDNMRDRGIDIVGLGIKLTNTSKRNHKEYKKVLKTFGRTTFFICFTCWLKSLGVKR